MSEQRLPRLNREHLKDLAERYLRDAQILLENQCWASVYYLAGYSVECALKARIARQVREHDFPDKNLATKAHSHDLKELLGLADLQEDLQSSNGVSTAWRLVVSEWRAESRYVPVRSETEAKEMLHAVGDTETGVLPWLKKRW